MKKNSPKHYLVGGIETVDFIKAKLPIEAQRGFFLGNVIKYASRMYHKEDAALDALKLHIFAGWLLASYGTAFPPELRVSSKKASRKSKPKNKKKKSP